jgi:hypothetical protein
MPRAVTTLPENYDSVTRPVVLDVVRLLKNALRLDAAVEVVFPGGSETVAQDGSLIDGTRQVNQYGHNTRIKVEIQERAIEDRILTMAVQQDEHRPVFADPLLGVFIRPIYSMSEIQVSFQVRFQSRTEAQRFRDDTLLRCANLRNETPLQMNYHYTLPIQHLHMLKAVHALREAQAGYGESLDVWVANHLDARATNLTTLIGTYPTLAIPEHQIHNWGAFSSFVASEDSAEKENESGKWVINFSYRFQYDKPIACRAEWPLVIHNQLIDTPWANEPNASGTQVDPWRQTHYGSATREAMDVLSGLYDDPCAVPYQQAVIPAYDEWAAKQIRPDTVSMIQILIGVSPQDLHEVVDLRDLPDVQIDPEVLAFMATESPYMTTYGNSVFHVGLYEGDTPQADQTVRVSPYLLVTSTNAMDLRKVYHLRVAVLSDLLMMRRPALERLSAGGVAAAKLLMDLQFRLGSNALRPRVDGGYVSLADIREIGIRLNEHKRAYGRRREALLLTVGQYRIITHRATAETSNGSTDENPASSSAGSATGDGGGQIVSRCDG